jgi:RNA polymerase sigma-70 factor (ECF subfamily)
MTSTSDRSSTSAEHTLASIQRRDWGRLLSLVVARTRRLDLAEDALAEAFARAAERWPSAGVPDNPGAWLYTTAHRLVVGRLRAEATAGRKVPLLAVRPGWTTPEDPTDELADDRLHLILLCCHPALPRESRSALALRLVVGTPTEQIARLFLVPTPTMAARLTRAKKKIVVAGIPLGSPVADELRARLDEVCRTIYLAFTAGYAPGAGPDLVRSDLAGDAVRLATVLHSLVPDAPQVRALRSLLVLQHARRDTRVHDGHLVTLAEQDRARWRRDEIGLGLALVDAIAPDEGYAEELRLQALIAAEHARAATAADTDWTAIAAHYAALDELTGSPVVRLNRAVAVAEAEGPLAGLALLADLDHRLTGTHRLDAVRGDLARRAGDVELAARSFRAALATCANEVEREHLQRRLDEVEREPRDAV